MWFRRSYAVYFTKFYCTVKLCRHSFEHRDSREVGKGGGCVEKDVLLSSPVGRQVITGYV